MSYILKILIFVLIPLTFVSGRAFVTPEDEDQRMHPTFNFASARLHKRSMPMIRSKSSKIKENSPDYWNNAGQDFLQKQLESKSNLNTDMAENVIMFLGDGMSIPTVAAGRVYNGGEEKQFSFEKFPYVGLSMTYCANAQVADSACSATAYLGGVKANYGTLGLTSAILLDDCFGQNSTENHVHSIAAWAQDVGMATGLITTTSVTHATPAGIYAHAANRNWENDAEVIKTENDPNICIDIASQLVHGEVGHNLNVIFGGGQEHFLPNDTEPGKRLDGRNLIKEWQNKNGPNAHYISNKRGLFNLPKNTEKVMALFAPIHIPYHMDADPTEIPTLEEMVRVAINILEEQSQGKGYFLLVEGGRIDHAHHDTLPMKALNETVEFDKAIKFARAVTNIEETLIVVTADHSHTMSLAGYSSRNHNIFGVSDSQLASDELPYATLSYANGPGFESNIMQNSVGLKRTNLSEANMKDKTYMHPSTAPLDSETHGGDDVAVYASGPFAHLFTGVYEQNFIPHAMGYASCTSKGKTACNGNSSRN